MIQYNTPWKHYVTDNFLESQEFEIVQKLSARWQKPKTQNEKFNLYLCDFKFYKETLPFYDEAIEVEKILSSALHRLSETFSLAGTYKGLHIEYVNCGNNFYYPVHKDASSKIFTNVLYVSPEGDGTRIFAEKTGEAVKSVDWKANRLLSFKPSHNTWHDYYSTKENRISFNLCFVSFVKNRNRPLPREEKDLTLL